MRLGFSIAVAGAKAGSCSSDSTPSLGTSICHGGGPKKKKRKKKKKKAAELDVSGLSEVVYGESACEGMGVSRGKSVYQSKSSRPWSRFWD